MGKRNREKRAAKQRQRHRSAGERPRPTAGPAPDRAEILEHLVIALSTAAIAPASLQAAELLETFRGFERELDIAADLVVHEAIGAAWAHGWSPADLHEVARRRADAATAAYLDEAVVLESRQYATASLHPRWRAELADIAADVGSAARTPQMWRWAAAHAADERAALTVVVRVLHLLANIPAVTPMLTRPGRYRETAAVIDDVDEKVLARVRALLAKAEATEYADEAEALSAKAQDLMVRHSLREAVVHHEQGRMPVAGSRRIWIDNPYVAAKVALVQAVAGANRSRMVWMKDMGFVVVVGMETDLRTVEMLSTSLLVQASLAMLLAGRRHRVRGQARTKSFRHSFLVGYANRINERLSAASSSATAELERDERLLPVLAARTHAADEAFARCSRTRSSAR